MKTVPTSLLTAAAFLALTACQSTGPCIVAPASEAETAALLGRIKTLEGTWTSTDESGVTNVAAVFKTVAAGSAVREIMFPGQPYEMTNLYHMDGADLVMTHYCAAGSQPRMRARTGSEANVLHFEFDSITNLHAAEEEYMGSMTLTLVDADHARCDWASYKGGERVGTMAFDLTRQK
jgi:hypothetical protein